jgi:Arylsulfatase A and related enzymes
MVIYTSDHGEQLGYHGMWWKCTMFEESARIPMIVYHPNLEHKDIDNPVDLVDLFPTMCDVFSVEKPTPLDGHSLLPLMRDGKDDERPDFAFSEYNAHGIDEGMFMIRWDKYKYVYFTGGYTPQLFDLEKDPCEDHDLAIEKPDDTEVKRALAEGHRRLYSVCNPEETTKRALDFQERERVKLGLPDEYTLERSFGAVPHPEYSR